MRRGGRFLAGLRRLLVALLIAPLVPASAAGDDEAGAHHHHDQPGGDVLLFVSAEAHRFSPRAQAPDLNEDAPLAADVVFTLNRERLRVFGEFLASSWEHDLERFQLGFEATPDTVFWLGRFHQPASAWNLEHHHGRYLQTAVTRPSIELWEDEHGILPQHVSGLLVESRRDLDDNQALRFALGTGLGVVVSDEGLEPVDILKLRRGGRQVSWTGRLAYVPDQLGANQFGLLAAHHRTPVEDERFAAALAATRVRQDIVGIFGDWRPDPWRVVGALYDIGVTLDDGSAARREHFRVAYVQAERQLPASLTAYLRHEDSDGARRSTYVAVLSPDFELRRTVSGLRWDGFRHQAVTFEVGRGATPRTDRWEARLLWSAVFP